jgi:hypothetical protein
VKRNHPNLKRKERKVKRNTTLMLLLCAAVAYADPPMPPGGTNNIPPCTNCPPTTNVFRTEPVCYQATGWSNNPPPLEGGHWEYVSPNPTNLVCVKIVHFPPNTCNGEWWCIEHTNHVWWFEYTVVPTCAYWVDRGRFMPNGSIEWQEYETFYNPEPYVWRCTRFDPYDTTWSSNCLFRVRCDSWRWTTNR